MIKICLVRWLEADNLLLTRLESAHRRELRELTKLRQRRDQRLEKLYGRLIRIRTTFEDTFGQGMAPVFLGLEPGMNRVEPMVLQRIAREAIEILSDPDFALPDEPVVNGLWENPAGYAEEIREALEPFEKVLDQIVEQKRDVETALKAKTEKLEKAAYRLTWSIRLFEPIYHLAGLGFHAKRLRPPTSSRSANGEPKETPDGETSPDATADSSAPTDDSSAPAANDGNGDEPQPSSPAAAS